ncbi:hypothetical protein NL676_007307 [Syzygium grande]|nr:hypothetical protein NL676_007307 [Syzygium grande]
MPRPGVANAGSNVAHSLNQSPQNPAPPGAANTDQITKANRGRDDFTARAGARWKSTEARPAKWDAPKRRKRTGSRAEATLPKAPQPAPQTNTPGAFVSKELVKSRWRRANSAGRLEQREIKLRFSPATESSTHLGPWGQAPRIRKITASSSRAKIESADATQL